MERIQRILRSTEFESSTFKTQQFNDFAKTFKRELNKELKTIGVTKVKYNIGHFYISGFFEKDNQIYYFSLSDVRGMKFQNKIELLYRTAESYKDFKGGSNQYVTIEYQMAKNMNL
jgi:hypothetical protein